VTRPKNRKWIRDMGKYAQYLKRGRNLQQGFLTAPALADFTLGVATATTVPVTRVPNIPTGADGLGSIAVLAAGGGPAIMGPTTAASPFNQSGLVTATTYNIRVAWFIGATRISDYSPPRSVTTA
jgi:hypothetical protein